MKKLTVLALTCLLPLSAFAGSDMHKMSHQDKASHVAKAHDSDMVKAKHTLKDGSKVSVYMSRKDSKKLLKSEGTESWCIGWC